MGQTCDFAFGDGPRRNPGDWLWTVLLLNYYVIHTSSAAIVVSYRGLENAVRHWLLIETKNRKKKKRERGASYL